MNTKDTTSFEDKPYITTKLYVNTQPMEKHQLWLYSEGCKLLDNIFVSFKVSKDNPVLKKKEYKARYKSLVTDDYVEYVVKKNTVTVNVYSAANDPILVWFNIQSFIERVVHNISIRKKVEVTLREDETLF